MKKNSQPSSSTQPPPRSLRSNTDKSSERPPPVLETSRVKKQTKPKPTPTETSTPGPSQVLSLSEENIQIDLTSDSELEELEIEQIRPTSPKRWEAKLDYDFDDDIFSADPIHNTVELNPIVFRPIIPMDDLIDERDQVQDSVKDIQITLDNHDPAAPAVAVPLTLKHIDNEIHALQALFPRFEDLKLKTRKAFRGKPALEIQTALDLVKDIEKAWKSAKIQADNIKEALEACAISRVKPVEAEPPTFDGQQTNWKSFMDQFTSLVVNNKKITPTDKLIILKKSLEKGSAYAIVQNFPLTEVDWTNAWETVKIRYDHQRELIYASLAKLHDLQPIQGQSQVGIRHIIDTVKDVTRAMDNLQIDTTNWDPMLNSFIRRNLDYRTRQEFEKSLPDDKPHTTKVFLDYLNNLATALGTASISTKPQTQQQPQRGQEQKRRNGGASAAPPAQEEPGPSTSQQNFVRRCIFCNEQHQNSKCHTLAPLSPAQRLKLVADKRLCRNCLGKGNHKIADCRSKPCGVGGCTEKHNRLLHSDRSTATGAQKAEAQTLLTSTLQASTGIALLLTAYVNLVQAGETHKVQVLIDPGSQINLITDKLAKRLQLFRKPSAMVITGVGNPQSTSAHGMVTVNISSCVNNSWETNLYCYVLPKLALDKPSQEFSLDALKQFNYLKLADETYNVPGPVDMLLGIQVFSDILETNHIKGNPTAFSTKLGYIIGGELDLDKIQSSTPTQEVLTCCAEFDMTRFWKQEEVPEYSKLSPTEKDVEQHYAVTHEFDKEQGKFTVELPFVPDHTPLGESRNQAVSRLIQLERRLERNPDQKILYHQYMKEYIEEGGLQKITPQDPIPPKDQIFYLPHHYVEKESTTTKLRVVFDASAKSSSGISLNDILYTGPTLQPELATTLSRFRENKIAFSADIRKMFLQIGVKRKHQDFLRVLWRERPGGSVIEYRFTCVVFGLACSPYLAMKTMQQLADNEKVSFPLGAEVLSKDFYVDDCLSGAQSVEDALEKQRQLIAITGVGGFTIRKWSSNHPAILEAVPVKDREIQLPLDLNSEERIKTLGIFWDPASDEFNFKVNLTKEKEFTKRSVASHAAKTYDPTGLIQPVIIKAKVILQELWESKIGWDDPIPEEIKKDWLSYYEELPNLEKLRIPRHVTPKDPVIVNLHGFSDASSKAIGAVVYVVGQADDGSISSRLLTSKSKVAPLRMVSIPRLELMGAVLLTKLLKCVTSTFNTKFQDVHYWSDSTSVLGQIQKPSRSFKTFVGNRVSYIQEYSDIRNWHHVRTEENPADLVSREVSPLELIDNDFWWKGPAWLETPNLPIGLPPPVPPNVDLEEVTKAAVLLTTAECSWADEMLKSFNSLKKLKRVTVFILRKFRPELRPKPRGSIVMSVAELEMAMKTWIKLVQAQHFKQEIHWLKTGKEFPNGSAIKSLNPFLDADGVMRVGGRLENATELHEDQKHPAFLPKKSKLVTLIIEDAHVRYKHAQAQLLTSVISSQYWIISLRPQARRFIKNCITCQKVAAQIGTQMMGNLPRARLEPSRPFLHTGVDYAGPIKILPKSGRGQRTMKSWIAVFVCFSTKAVHLELATELSTAAFLAALRRFASRRGKPNCMYSDEGTNFTGAKNEMEAFMQEIHEIATQDEVAASLANDGITWKLNPPGAPHMGGLWEAAVKSMKLLLRRAMDSTNFTIEEATTLLCEIEACLNSRPLTPMSTDPSDLDVLTPGHFLIGEPLLAVPGHDLTQVQMNRLDRFEKVQQQKTHFWNRWQMEYLHTLQNRPKWTSPSPNFKIGDLVLIKDESLAPQKWKIGRVQEVHQSKDGKVRVATVRTIIIKPVPKAKGMKQLDLFQAQESILKRPIHKLVRLPYEQFKEDPQKLEDSAVDTN